MWLASTSFGTPPKTSKHSAKSASVVSRRSLSEIEPTGSRLLEAETGGRRGAVLSTPDDDEHLARCPLPRYNPPGLGADRFPVSGTLADAATLIIKLTLMGAAPESVSMLNVLLATRLVEISSTLTTS